MKKVKIILLTTIIISNSLAQQKNNDLQIKILNFKDTISSINNEILFSIINQSYKYPIIIPNSKAQPIVKEISNWFYYEVLYIDKKGKIDTLFKKTLNHDVERITQIPYEILYPENAKKFTCPLDLSYFKKEGNYKVRIVFDAGYLNKFYGIISSQWITVYIINNGLYHFK